MKRHNQYQYRIKLLYQTFIGEKVINVNVGICYLVLAGCIRLTTTREREILDEKQRILFAKQNWIKRKPEMIRMKSPRLCRRCPTLRCFCLVPTVARSLMCRAATQCQPNLDLEAPDPTQSPKLQTKQNSN
jgi:hypothetical protein